MEDDEKKTYIEHGSHRCAVTRDDWVGPSVGPRIVENDYFRTDRLTKGNLLRGFALCSCWLPAVAQPY